MTVRFAKSLEPLLVPIDQVREHPDNPNHGDDENLATSIRVNGFVTACTADANTGYMVAGNTRLRTLRKLGATHIPIIWEDQWDESGAKRYLIGDNASARKAVMDNTAELAILRELMDTELGLEGTSVTESEYEQMLMEGAVEPPPEGGGFGANPAPLGMYQIIITFEEDPDERDAIFAELSERFDDIRTADL